MLRRAWFSEAVSAVTPSRGRVASPATHDCLLAQALSSLCVLFRGPLFGCRRAAGCVTGSDTAAKRHSAAAGCDHASAAGRKRRSRPIGSPKPWRLRPPADRSSRSARAARSGQAPATSAPRPGPQPRVDSPGRGQQEPAGDAAAPRLHRGQRDRGAEDGDGDVAPLPAVVLFMTRTVGEAGDPTWPLRARSTFMAPYSSAPMNAPIRGPGRGLRPAPCRHTKRWGPRPALRPAWHRRRSCGQDPRRRCVAVPSVTNQRSVAV